MVKERRLHRGGGEGKKKKKKKAAAVTAVIAEVNRGAWTAEEDMKLVNYVAAHGNKHWRTLPSKAGLKRCGKSCRLRWLNYLRPGIKRGNISEDEEDLIIRLHNLIGNRWSIIAGRIPGRTDNEIKNYWNTHLRKRSLSIDDLNSKQNHDPNIAGTAIFSLPSAQTVPNSSNAEVMPPTLQPANEKQRPTVISGWMERAASEFDIERLFGFGSELGLDDFELLPSQHGDQFFEFEDLEQWLDYQPVYALHSSISG